MESLIGLSSIDSIKGYLHLRGSPIKSLEPISSTIDYISTITTTVGLRNFRGLEKLKRLDGIIYIDYLLEDFSGLDSLEFLGQILIQNFSSLKSLKGLEHIDSIRTISISDINSIESLDGLENTLWLRTLKLINNPNLNDCSIDWLCENIDNIEYLNIQNNGDECNSPEKIKDVCKRRYKIYVESYYDVNENGVKEEDDKLISGPLYKISPQDNYTNFSYLELPFLNVGEGDYEVTIDEKNV